MFTSDIDRSVMARHAGKTALVYLAVSAGALAVGKIYQLFGHGVTSPFMSYLFAVPLVLGSGVFLVLFLAWGGRRREYIPTKSPRPKGLFRWGYNLYNSGVATLTAASLLQGIFEIAGTGSSYVLYLVIAGAAMTVAGMLCLLTSASRIFLLPLEKSNT